MVEDELYAGTAKSMEGVCWLMTATNSQKWKVALKTLSGKMGTLVQQSLSQTVIQQLKFTSVEAMWYKQSERSGQKEIIFRGYDKQVQGQVSLD